MSKKPLTEKYLPNYDAKLRERGIQLFREQRLNYLSDNTTYLAIAFNLGCSPDTLRAWCAEAPHDAVERDGLTPADRERIKHLERANHELRVVNEILKQA